MDTDGSDTSGHKAPRLDEIGPWSEIKLQIIKEYAAAYSMILTKNKLYHVYIDAFAGSGVHKRKSEGNFILGSPVNALSVEPPFKHYYFIDLDPGKSGFLGNLVGNRRDVTIDVGDCNVVLLDKVLPRVRWRDYRRGLCLLDPYGLHLDWQVAVTAGQMQSIEIFLNFPLMDINMNVVRENPDTLDNSQLQRMDSFWGDRSWFKLIYGPSNDLFIDDRKQYLAQALDVLPKAFRQRLKDKAGFKFVPEPIPMRNSSGSIVYFLFFASQKPAAQSIVEDIFNKWRNRKP